MTQIKNILDDEIELMKTKCENSAIDFLFVLDGSGDRNDDSKTSVSRYHIQKSHVVPIWKDFLWKIFRSLTGLYQRMSVDDQETVS